MRSAVVLTLVAVMVLAGLIVSVTMAAVGVAADRHIEANRSTLRETAGGIVAQAFSVNRSTWQADRARARDVVGGEFAESQAPALDSPPPDGVDSITWRPDGVGLINVGSRDGDVLVYARVDTVGVVGAQPLSRRQAVQAHLELVDGRWLLTRLDVLT